MSLDIDLYYDVDGKDENGNDLQYELWYGNITHNLNRMAKEAGIYEALWRPEELPVPPQRAINLVPLLRAGLERLVDEPECFKDFHPKNGWGSYETLVEFVRKYLTACTRYPNAKISVSR